MKNMLFAGAALLCAAGMSARADIVFNFNSLSPGTGNSTNETAIQNYMDGLLGCVGCVTVTGAATNQTYTGDSHVVGNNGHSLTLGTSDNATNNSTLTPTTSFDTFLSNITNVAGLYHNQVSQISQDIIIQFSTPVNLKSFDFEIFPDASCPNSGSCPSLPDFELYVNGSSSATFTQLAAFPGSTPNAGTHTGTNGSSTASPLPANPELAAQWIGTWSGNLTGVTELDFRDWPAGIAVDNIDISTVPEPRGASLLLGALLLAGLAGKKLFAFARA